MFTTNDKSTKYRLIRVHPEYSTFEWRGPRDFLNESNKKDVQNFLKLLYEIIIWIAKAQNADSLPNGITKNEFFSKISTSINIGKGMVDELDKDTSKRLLNLLSNGGLIPEEIMTKFPESIIRLFQNYLKGFQYIRFIHPSNVIQMAKHGLIEELDIKNYIEAYLTSVFTKSTDRILNSIQYMIKSGLLKYYTPYSFYELIYFILRNENHLITMLFRKYPEKFVELFKAFPLTDQQYYVLGDNAIRYELKAFYDFLVQNKFLNINNNTKINGGKI
jgi:hypothetical protein